MSEKIYIKGNLYIDNVPKRFYEDGVEIISQKNVMINLPGHLPEGDFAIAHIDLYRIRNITAYGMIGQVIDQESMDPMEILEKYRIDQVGGENGPMSLNTYQEEAAKTAFYEHDDVAYCALGITGEGGEIADHVKKMLRDDDGILTENRRLHLKKELGDVLWYVARMAGKLGYTLEDIAQTNLDKIRDRLSRNVEHGSGDNR